MTIILKNKQTLEISGFCFRCCIGQNGLTKRKKEGDKKTPKGTFYIGDLFYRNKRVEKPKTLITKKIIKKNMGWCDDVRFPNSYNKLITTKTNVKHEKLYRQDQKYDLLIPIKYNYHKPITGKGSCIFIHLTKNYRPTAGCIALAKKDFLILLKLINRKTKIKIL